MNSSIVAFYSGWRADSQGRTLDEIRSWGFDRLEMTHDYIQWLFPLRERSQFNEICPRLTDEQIAAFRRDETLRKELLKSLDVMLAFYGFHREELVIVRSENWAERSSIWLKPGNHNYMRMTRILKSLVLLGLRECASALFQALEQIYHSGNNDSIGIVTFQLWQRALKD